MKQVMRFNIFGNVVAVYWKEKTDSYLIYQMIGRKRFFIDEEDALDTAAQTAINFCYENG